MAFRKTRNTNCKIIPKVLPDKCTKLMAKAEILRSWFPVRMILRRIAAQCKNIVDASILNII